MDELSTVAETVPAAHQDRRATRVLAVLPDAFQKPAAFFWAMNAHLLPTPTPLAMRLRVWIANEGLTAAEAKAAFAALTRPEAAARHRFAADLLAELAAEVDAVVKRRRAREAAAKRAADDDPANRATPEQVEALRVMTADLFKGAPKGPVRA